MPLAKTVWRLLLPYKGDNLKTITTDNGSEFAAMSGLQINSASLYSLRTLIVHGRKEL